MTTEKMIRKQLTEETGEDMAPRKAFIKDQASACSAVSCLMELRMGSCVTLHHRQPQRPLFETAS